jgi:hypothetical protein
MSVRRSVVRGGTLAGVFVALLAVLAGSAARATQSGRNLEAPPTWQARYDDAAAGKRVHVVMRPGWHINPGPAGIFWDSSRFAEGNFSISSTIFLFPAGTGDPPAQVDAPYGVLFGGVDLDGAMPAYVTFLLRNDGTFRVARHGGGTTAALIGWSVHDAIVTWEEGDAGTAKNTLVVDATDEAVTFWVNDQQVAALPRVDVPVDGVVGLRAGAGVSLHITDLVIGPNRR